MADVCIERRFCLCLCLSSLKAAIAKLGTVSSAGFDFNSWNENTPLSGSGAVFWLDSTKGPSKVAGDVTIAQLTVKAGQKFSGKINAMGHTLPGSPSNTWDTKGIAFANGKQTRPSHAPQSKGTATKGTATGGDDSSSGGNGGLYVFIFLVVLVGGK